VIVLVDLVGVMSRPQVVALFGLSYRGLVHHYWIFQFVTAPLVHANLTHLAFMRIKLQAVSLTAETAENTEITPIRARR
jgi:membrane associated rhomboid family serine protease